jgi:hypothetical protein
MEPFPKLTIYSVPKQASKDARLSQAWWCMPLIPALGGRGRWISEFETRLVYKVSSMTARAIQRNPVSKNQKKKKKTKKKKKKKKTKNQKPKKTKNKKQKTKQNKKNQRCKIAATPRIYLITMV